LPRCGSGRGDLDGNERTTTADARSRLAEYASTLQLIATDSEVLAKQFAKHFPSTSSCCASRWRRSMAKIDADAV
jgi:hypothetical protein